MPDQPLRIVVLGYIVRGPLGGMAWHHLQYVMGLARLGHEVHFVEESGDTEWCCYDPSRDLTDADPTYGLAFAARAFALAGLPRRWTYYDAHTGRWHGPAADEALGICRQADVVLNLGGGNPLRPWLLDAPHRVLIDTDPAFTQIRHLTDSSRRQAADGHTAFFSYGENIGRGATVPDDGFDWQPTRQPIVLDAWPVVPGPAGGSFTTVMQWDSYRPLEYGGRAFGMKSDSFRRYLDLPHRTGASFEIAVGGPAADGVLTPHGWSVRNPIKLIPDLTAYREFIERSKAEFTVAKHGYTATRTGWFSDRSAAYLASGRPVITEDTGFSEFLPVGDGLLAFASIEEAAACVLEVNTRYEHHCRAARAIAGRYFDSATVLGDLLQRVVRPGRRQRMPGSTVVV
jgi:hypothetical protein